MKCTHSKRFGKKRIKDTTLLTVRVSNPVSALSYTCARACMHLFLVKVGSKVQAGQEDREITVLPRRKTEEPDDTTTVSVIHL